MFLAGGVGDGVRVSTQVDVVANRWGASEWVVVSADRWDGGSFMGVEQVGYAEEHDPYHLLLKCSERRVTRAGAVVVRSWVREREAAVRSGGG